MTQEPPVGTGAPGSRPAPVAPERPTDGPEPGTDAGSPEAESVQQDTLPLPASRPGDTVPLPGRSTAPDAPAAAQGWPAPVDRPAQGQQPPGYPAQGWSAPGYPTQGYPTQGYPTQGYPAPGYPGPEEPARGSQAQAHQAQGYPPRHGPAWHAQQPGQQPQGRPVGSDADAPPGPPIGPPVPGPDEATVLRRRRAGGRVLLVTVLALVSLLAGFAGGWLADRGSGGGSIQLVAPDGDADTSRAPDSVAGVAARVLPSVVSIEVRFAGGQGNGSGFVLREDGYILTNNHVVDDARDSGEIVVVFSDGSQEEAQVVGATSAYDLAVLRVDRGGLPALRLAESSSLVVGDPVIAVGAPLGLESTVTTGIVSALNRPVAAGEGQDSAFINAIQTDAAINPGNSGGPLVDMDGDVVGINSAIARAPGNLGPTGGNIGLGFAIPGEQAARTAQQIIEEGRATYPVVGILLDRSYAGEGVRVVPQDQGGTPAVTPDGPADRAGIKPGDVVVGFEGRPMTDPDQLIVAIRAQRPGDTVTMTVRSGSRERTVDVTLGESPAEEDS